MSTELELFGDRLHPVMFVANCSNIRPALSAICEPCGWRTVLDDKYSLTQLVRLAAEHSGIEWPP